MTLFGSGPCSAADRPQSGFHRAEREPGREPTPGPHPYRNNHRRKQREQRGNGPGRTIGAWPIQVTKWLLPTDAQGRPSGPFLGYLFFRKTRNELLLPMERENGSAVLEAITIR